MNEPNPQPEATDAPPRRSRGWTITGVAVLTAIATYVIYLALAIFLGPTGFIIAVVAYLVLLLTAAGFVTTSERRSLGIGLLVGALAALALAFAVDRLTN